MLVQAFHPVRQPAHAGLEDRSAQPRKEIEHAAPNQRGERAHALEGIGGGVLQEQGVGHVEGAQPVWWARGTAMEAGGQIGVLASLPNRMKGRMVEQSILDM